VSNDRQGPRLGCWYLLGSRWMRLDAIGTLVAPTGGAGARRYVLLEELTGLPQNDHPAFLERP
jgi:hypothetical protein